MFNCLILPLNSYVDTAWGAPSVACRDNLQRLANRAVRIIQRDSSSESIFGYLSWENLITSREMHKCDLVFKRECLLTPSEGWHMMKNESRSQID